VYVIYDIRKQFFFPSTVVIYSLRTRRREARITFFFSLACNFHWLIRLIFLSLIFSVILSCHISVHSYSSIITCRIKSVNSSTTSSIMLTPQTTKDDDETKISSEYYSNPYQTSTHHYYYHPHHHPVTFNDESTNLHQSQTSNLYDSNQYYTFSPNYSQPVNQRLNDDESTNQLPSSMYMPIYPPRHHHYPSDDMLFPPKANDSQTTTIYDYNLSPIPSNQVFHQHQTYLQTPIEQTPCSTSNGGEYLTPYVNQKLFSKRKDKPHLVYIV